MDKIKEIFWKILCFIGLHKWSVWSFERGTSWKEVSKKQFDYWEDTRERYCERCCKKAKKITDSGHY